jgi:tRNA (adenine22-N1)-methyltransferase
MIVVAMNESISLSKRLLAIAELVPKDVRLIDVGTDHALLPIFLLQRNIISQAIGVDRSLSPLNQAKLHREREKISESQLILHQSNGFSDVVVLSGDVTVIAGMGGRSIIDIISNPKVQKCSLLILQPNRYAMELRSYLSNNSWKIENEQMIVENQQYYPIICASSGIKSLTEKQCYFGPILQQKRSPEWLAWLEREHSVLFTIQGKALDKMPSTKKTALQWIQEELSC